MPEGESQTNSTENQQEQQPQETTALTPQNTEETQPPQDTQPTEQTQETKPTEPPKDVEQTLEQQGFDYSKLEEEYFSNNGELTKETKEKLNKIGITDEFINDFINGKKAIYEQEINELSQSVGGREQYDSLIEWAGKNLDPSTIQAVNSIRDKNILKEFILPKLKEKMEEKEGKQPTVTLKGTASSQTLDLFESQEQMFEAIRDKRYNTDPAYCEKVTAKIKASREAGIDLGL